ncbi:MAG: hypothetical protein DI598_10230, partial [Pseudopedobacter saltans]
MKRKTAHKGKFPVELSQEERVNSIDEFKQSILPAFEENILDTALFYQDLICKINLFVPGKYMWYVVQRLTIFQMGGMVCHFTGKDLSYWKDKNPEEYFAYIYPEDIPYVMTFAKVVYEFLSKIDENDKNYYHPNLYFRLKNPDGNGYKHIMFQYIYWKYDTEHGIESILHVITDISHIEQVNPKPMLTILDEKNNVLHFSKTTNDEVDNALNSILIRHLTKREKDIIKLLAKGL